MRSYLTHFLGISLIVGVAASAAAQPNPQPPRQPPPQTQPPKQPAPKQQPPKQQPPKPQAPAPKPQAAKQPPPTQQPSSRYGNWNSGWGARPPSPPKHWTKTDQWYAHVRACQQRYRSYDPRTDTFRTDSGQRRRCTL